eukprot:6211379-Prymnesium_polylepis.3
MANGVEAMWVRDGAAHSTIDDHTAPYGADACSHGCSAAETRAMVEGDVRGPKRLSWTVTSASRSSSIWRSK